MQLLHKVIFFRAMKAVKMKVRPQIQKNSFLSFCTIRLAARNMYCISAVIGVILFAPLPMLTIAHAEILPSLCEAISTLPEIVHAFAATQCDVSQRIFFEGLNPSAGFKFMEPVSRPGTYNGTDAYGRCVSFEAVQTVTLPLFELHSDQFTSADEGYMCIGWLQGPAGRVSISAICLKKESLTGDPVASFFIVVEVLSNIEVLACAQSERILAGVPVDIAPLGHTFLLTEGTFIPESQGESVLATQATGALLLVSSNFINEHPVSLGNPVPIDTRNCVKDATHRFEIADRAARRTAGVCMGGVMSFYALAMGACAAGGIFLWILVPSAMAGCVAIALASVAIGSGVCCGQMIVQQAQNNENLALELAICARDNPIPEP